MKKTERIFMKCPQCERGALYKWMVWKPAKRFSCAQCHFRAPRIEFLCTDNAEIYRHINRKKDRKQDRAARVSNQMPKFRGRWKGRLMYHWKRSPSKFSITAGFLDRLWESQQGRCAYCERAIDDDSLVLEHMRPLYHGGRTSEDNICLACQSCNADKGAMPFEKWCERIGWKV